MNDYATNCIDYGQWDTPNTVPFPYYVPPPTYTPPTQVWITPSPFIGTPAWEIAAAEAYRAMEAYYKALTERLADSHSSDAT